ncbi:tyrosine-protein kinase RYK-like isoform X1 [Haliotis rufescens]|uniref:tyrosine-protein kinase RYK-like isoform X1 n=1 Tax=Haliotis rufescens TaxID=6454 RepID=UPI00201F9D0C|nr:tyrosine-protein kinase RYK-like isoform X1 [Haliotis rufescens]
MPPSLVILGGLVFLGCFSVSLSYLNLYMDAAETLRLLGITAELYYVRNGIINNYALTFNLPLPPDIDEIYFTWQRLREQPAMFYRMKFTVLHDRALMLPEANISNEGQVPSTLSVFQVRLPCTGEMSAQVDVIIQMNISIFSASNLTVLNFKRRKTCIKVTDGAYVRDYPFTQGEEDYVEAEDRVGSLTTSTHIFYIAVGCACAIILLIALAVAVYYLNSQKSNDRYTKRMNYYDSSSSQALTAQSQTFLRPDTPNNASGAGLPNFRRGISPVTELKPTDIKSMLSEIAVERKRIALGDLLMEGTFGRIYLGTLIGEDENEVSMEQEVYIKTLTDQARGDQLQVFLTESCMLKGLIHQNINPVVGACVDGEIQPFMIYPYSNEGNLKKFLLKCRMSECGSRYTLSTQQLVYMAIQIIRGIQYLHRKKIIHKDIATRNCVVDNDFVVKLTDNSLSRDVFPSDYTCLGDNENRPVKWLAVEALLERRFSPASDVWAFGVTLWEMMTLGQQPYADIDPFEMAAYLQEGYRIAQPHNCPDELFAVMACCWAMSPDERPKFTQLLVCLQDFYTALGRFI